jgi:hypothetical protein
MNVDSDIGPDVPELVPARMVNEFSYCSRLLSTRSRSLISVKWIASPCVASSSSGVAPRLLPVA